MNNMFHIVMSVKQATVIIYQYGALFFSDRINKQTACNHGQRTCDCSSSMYLPAGHGSKHRSRFSAIAHSGEQFSIVLMMMSYHLRLAHTLRFGLNTYVKETWLTLSGMALLSFKLSWIL